MAEDLRLQRTYDSLTEAFRQLIEQKNFEQITVKELCALAKTRTATFYSHFSDKYDFFAFMVKRMRNQFITEKYLPVTDDPKAYFISLISLCFDFVEEYEKFLNAIGTDSMLSVIAHTTSENYHKELARHFSDLKETGARLPIESEILAEMFVGAMSQTSRWWLNHRQDISKEEIVEKISITFEAMIGH